ncbi:cytochrome c biogenesis CcdA family protein [Gloeobacter morelensis]|uniref:Cytochrome c biogenesis protein CcdA n=1 Tax=Gloeobacter morelensis MG652769 TaxID=2781736 RepID=A0ABY3PND5_9CYAN|nr:cytochrome c biogenesis CcdA family protein [Gloeobacter morelensis]UFP95201.1 cytochrome c biogenesis protein CcdA [Gloeobacter morelensis MG652769]
MGAVPLGLAFAGGLLTVLSPCILPVLPILVGRSLRSHRFGPLALVIGLVGGFALAGSLLGVTAEWLAGLASFLRTAAIALLLVLGLAALLPEWSHRLWARLGGFQPLEPRRDGLWGELLVGSQLGLIWTPCAGPVLGSILTLAAVGGQPAGAFGLLLVYGLGAAVPMLVFAYGGRYLSAQLLGLRAQGELLQRIGGAAVAATALAMLLGWDVTVQMWLAPLLPTPTL